MIYVARQNLISTAHVDLNCGKTASRAPQTGFFFFFLAISPRGLLTVRCHREQTESSKYERALTLLVLSDTTSGWATWGGNMREPENSPDG